MISKNIFYVYIYLDPRKRGKYIYEEFKFNYEPFYVGKGKGDQIKSHLNESRKIFRSVVQIFLYSDSKSLNNLIRFHISFRFNIINDHAPMAVSISS